MKRIFLFVFCIGSFALSAQDLRDHRLTISSQGMVRVTPDVIKCSVTLNGSFFRGGGITVDKVCDKVLADLRIKGLAKMNVVDVEDGEDYEEGGRYNAPAYYNRTYTVTFSKAEDYTKLSTACAQYVQNPQSKVNCSLTYLGLTDSTLQSAKLAAFKDALAQAKIKAGYVTSVLGGNVGGLLAVTDNGNSYEEDDQDGTDGLGYQYNDYYIPGRPLKIPFVSYVNVVFALN